MHTRHGAGRGAALTIIVMALLCVIGSRSAAQSTGAPAHRPGPHTPRLVVFAFPDSLPLNIAASDTLTEALRSLLPADSLWILSRREWAVQLTAPEPTYFTHLGDYRAMGQILRTGAVILVRAENRDGGVGLTAWTLRPDTAAPPDSLATVTGGSVAAAAVRLAPRVLERVLRDSLLYRRP